MPSFRMHGPIFPADRALYIIWCEDCRVNVTSLRQGGQIVPAFAVQFIWGLSNHQVSDVVTVLWCG